MCTVPDCGAKHEARGYCKRHYARWRKYGDPLVDVQTRYKSPQERLAAKTRREGDCLIWTGNVGPKGYGLIRVGGKTVGVHRLAYELAYGPIPEGMTVDHRDCFRPPCVEPSHLRLLDRQGQQENRSGPTAKGTSGHRGVTFHKRAGKWQARVGTKYLGLYDTAEAAGEAARLGRLETFTHSDGR